MREITASPEKSPFCPWRTSTEEPIRWEFVKWHPDQSRLGRLINASFFTIHIIL